MSTLSVRFGERQIAVIPVTGFSGRDGAPSPFGPQDDPAIGARWAKVSGEKPEMFDGVVLLATDVAIARGRLLAHYAEVRFSAFDWWRASSPPRRLRNAFGAGVVFTADGAALLGRMARHTAAAGRLYFPCGTPDPEDVGEGLVDIEGSIDRELFEETGLSALDIAPTDERFVVFAPKIAACVRRYESPLTAAEMTRRVETHLSAQARPELDSISFVRSCAELTAASPDYVHLALRQFWSAG